MKYLLSILKTAGFVILFICALLTSSCKKSTDLKQKNALPSDVVFSTPAGIELAAIGIYSIAHESIFNGETLIRNELRGDDLVPKSNPFNIYMNNILISDGNADASWSKLYGLINQANSFIDGIRSASAKGIIPKTTAASYEGEARFIRALSHHELVINFARPYLDNAGANPGIPYRTLPVNTIERLNESMKLGRGTVKDDYTQILADLDFAEMNLADNMAHPISRVSKGAAIALKTRIKLHMADWDGVIIEAVKLGASGNGDYISPIGSYKLTAKPEGPFVNNSGNSESIFSIENTTNSNAGPAALPSILGFTDGNGKGEYITSPNLYNASFWVSSDSRRTSLQMRNTSDGSVKFVFNNKYRELLKLTDWTPIIRYAEVLLNAAEAQARINLPDALNLLNAVRNRAVAAEDQYTNTSFPTKKALIQAILNERRIEFAAEGLRWPDIHRLSRDPDFSSGGIPAKISPTDIDSDGTAYDIVNRPVCPAKIVAVTYDDHRFIWPIPQNETISNPLLSKQQNPGY